MAHYNVQETRRIAREEARKEVWEEARKVLEEARKEGIRNLIRINRKHEITKEETVFDLMDTYDLSDEEAHKTVELFW